MSEFFVLVVIFEGMGKDSEALKEKNSYKSEENRFQAPPQKKAAIPEDILSRALLKSQPKRTLIYMKFSFLQLAPEK
jgi:hypothetical protein